MSMWPVFLAKWQIKCCGEPFGVGDAVAWRLSLDTESSKRGWPADLDVELELTGSRPDRIVVGGAEIAIDQPLADGGRLVGIGVLADLELSSAAHAA
jgi:hypothetical protein